MPDLATRRFLELLFDYLPKRYIFSAKKVGTLTLCHGSTSFYALMDGDAYGIHIAHTYATRMRHYDGPQRLGQNLKWIGMRPSQWRLRNAEDSSTIDSRKSPTLRLCPPRRDTAVPLDTNERVKAVHLLKSKETCPDAKRELCRLMFFGYKYELEALSDASLATILP